MRKKIITLIMLVAAIPMALANGVKIDDLYYILDSASKTAEVTYDLTSRPTYKQPAYQNFNSKSVTIPATVQSGNDTYRVTSIGEYAFYYCGLTEVSFPEGLTTIGNNAFYNCSGLKEVRFPEGLTTIGENAFNNCIGLKIVSLPKSLTTLESGIFAGCESLTEVSFSEGITTIGGGMFISCKNLAEINFPESLNTIDERAFRECTGLTEITFPENLKTIGEGAFIYCSGLTEITFPESLNTIGQQAFYECTGLTKINFPESIQEIGEGELFGYEAFYGCTGLTEITFPENLKTIGSSAFYECTGLKKITFPESLKTIGSSAFYGCNGLKDITLPKSIQAIRSYAFYGCPGPKEITLPESIQTIGSSAFKNTDINFVYCHIKNPIEVDLRYGYAFDFENTSNGKKIIVYVPASSYEAYLNSPSWNEADLRVFPEEITGSFEIEDFEINANQTLTVPVNLDVNLYNYTYTGLQFDLEMPENISIESTDLSTELQEKGFKLTSQAKDNNITRFIIYPTNALTGITSTGSVLTLTLKAASDIAAGNAQINFTNAMITTPDAEDLYLSDSSTEVTVNATITKITISPAVKSIEVGQPARFEAVIEPVDAKNTDLIWSVSEPYSVTLRSSGLTATIVGEYLGTYTITAMSPFDPSIKGEATLNVVGKISIEGEKHAIKETETLTLTAKFSSQGVEAPAIVWSSSDPETATVDAQSGVVTGVKAGEVTITAAARDYEGISTTYDITVEPRILGDANDNGFVNVSDVVAIANYVVEYTVPRFCFVNADVDNNKSITSNDITGTVSIILNDDDYSVGPRNIRAYAHSSVDFLNACNFEAFSGRELNIGVNLDNSIDYVALQASLVVPQGMKVTDIKTGSRAANHSLMFNIKDDNTVKIVLFSLSNTPFASVDEPLFTIVAEASEDCGNLDIINILASDKDNNEYALGFTGGLNENFTTAIGEVDAAEGDVRYFTIDGVEIKNPSAGQLVIRIQDGKVEKVIVK